MNFWPSRFVAFFLTFTMALVGFAETSPVGEPDPGPLFGPEFTFWSADEYDNEDPHAVKKVKERAKNHLMLDQPPGAEFKFENNNFVSPNGWWFSFHRDPKVVEASVSPMTLAEFEKFAAHIQDAVFVTAANEGFFPSHYGGGGHINIDGDYFYERPLLFRNFVVDFINHSELSLGIFNYDTNNAGPFALLTSDVMKNIAEEIHRWDRFGWDRMNTAHVAQFVVQLNKILVDAGDSYFKYWHQGGSVRGKNTALYFGNLLLDDPGEARLEIRSVRPQASMDVWLRQIRLLKKRIEFLSQMNEPLPLKPLFQDKSVLIGVPVSKEKALNPPISAQLALNNFYLYVTESGERIEDHLDYIWPPWLDANEDKVFLESCNRILLP